MAMIAPTVDSVGDAALTNSIIDKSITELQDNVVTRLRDSAMSGCTALKKAVFWEVTGSQGSSIFSGCTALETVDFHKNVTFGSYSFQLCSALKALILRSTTLCEIGSVTPLEDSSIASGNGYIYVPAALVDAYKAHSGWGQYASQIRAIEDYPAVCGSAGKVWANCYSTTSRTNSVIRVGSRWIAGTTPYNYYSTNGKTWSKGSSNIDYIYDAVYANGLIVATTNNGLWYSTNGSSWTKGNAATAGSVAYADGLFVAGTDLGLLYSTDGKTWTSSNVTGEINCVKYANGLWVAGGSSNGAYYSADGMTWTQSNLTSQTLSDIEYYGGVWVIGSGYQSYKAYYSTDGMTWTQISGGDFGRNYGLRYANGLWVMTMASANSTSNNGLWYSEDGITWTKSNVSGVAYYDVEFGNGLWVALGSKEYSYSLDGKTWTTCAFEASGHIYSYRQLAHDNGLWLMATSGKGIYYSE